MSVSSGSARLTAIGQALKEYGEGGMRRELIGGMRLGAMPLVDAVHNAALTQLPKAGGLNRQVAGQRVTVSVSLARAAGVRLKTTAPDTQMTDSGFVRHPSIGYMGYDRSYWQWVTQEIPEAKGWWTNTLERKSVEVTPFLDAVLRKIAADIEAI